MTSSPGVRPDPDDSPSMLDLIRLSPRDLFPPGGRDLYRQIALLTDMDEGREVLVAACGTGVTAEYFAADFGVLVSAVDEDPRLIERAETRIRTKGLQGRVQFQCASMDALPYRDGVFDVVVAEVGTTASVEPEAAMAELVRMTRPGGHVVLVHLVWKAPVEPDRREVLANHLGARPLMMVELKRNLRKLGVTNLHSEAWSDEGTAFRPHAKKPFPDFSELFSISEKLGILRRAWSRWGWRGIQTVLAREREVHRLLTRERVLGLDLVKGTRAEPPPSDPRPDTGSDPALEAAPEPSLEPESEPPPEEDV